jgi:hypothetical protein
MEFVESRIAEHTPSIRPNEPNELNELNEPNEPNELNELGSLIHAVGKNCAPHTLDSKTKRA